MEELFCPESEPLVHHDIKNSHQIGILSKLGIYLVIYSFSKILKIFFIPSHLVFDEKQQNYSSIKQ